MNEAAFMWSAKVRSGVLPGIQQQQIEISVSVLMEAALALSFPLKKTKQKKASDLH